MAKSGANKGNLSTGNTAADTREESAKAAGTHEGSAQATVKHEETAAASPDTGNNHTSAKIISANTVDFSSHTNTPVRAR